MLAGNKIKLAKVLHAKYFLQPKVMLSKNQQASFVIITMAPALRQSVKNLLLHCVQFFYKINSSWHSYSIYRPEPLSDWKLNVYR